MVMLGMEALTLGSGLIQNHNLARPGMTLDVATCRDGLDLNHEQCTIAARLYISRKGMFIDRRSIGHAASFIVRVPSQTGDRCLSKYL